MARHVSSYSDEWRDVLDDPERLRRFISFVNAPDVPDPSHHLRSGTRPAGSRSRPVPRPDPSRPTVTVGNRSPSAYRRYGDDPDRHADLDRRLPARPAGAGAGRRRPGRRGAGRPLPRPTTSCSRSATAIRSPARTCCPGASSAAAAECRPSPHRCTSRCSTCAAGTASTCPGWPWPGYDARCRDGLVEVRLRQEALMRERTGGLHHRGHRRPAARRVGRAARTPGRPGGARPGAADRAAGRRHRAARGDPRLPRPAAGHPDGQHRHRHARLDGGGRGLGAGRAAALGAGQLVRGGARPEGTRRDPGCRAARPVVAGLGELRRGGRPPAPARRGRAGDRHAAARRAAARVHRSRWRRPAPR